jgi:hypothetical protein
MMGMGVAEEEIDNKPMRDVTPAQPQQNPFAAIAQKAREATAQPAQQAQDATEGVDQADTLDEGEALHWTDGYDPVNGIPGSKEWAWGMESAKDPEHTVRACPFEQGTQECDDWLGGFIGARRASE